MSGDAEASEMASETSGASPEGGMNATSQTSERRARSEPVVEDNGPWFVVFMVGLVLLFAAAFAAVIHSLASTFR